MKHSTGAARYDRAHQVVNALAAWNEHLSADDLHQKYCKMSVSPFVFYRGTAHLYWADFAGDWHVNRFGSAKTRTWLEGDAHAENIGAFTDQKGVLRYGMNDFDESIIADYQYDVWRFAVSLVLVARRNDCFTGKQKADVINAFCESYLDTMASLVGKEKKAMKPTTIEDTSGMIKDFLKKVKKKRGRGKMLAKWTRGKDGNRFQSHKQNPKLDKASEFERKDILAAMPDYGKTLSGDMKYSGKFFAVHDIARRLSAGTGSLGTSRYYTLINGETKSAATDRIIDIKRQSKPSAYEHLTKGEQVDYDRSFDNDAERQAVAYVALATEPDDLMGWMRLHNGYYSVRERSPYKDTFDTATLTKTKDFCEASEIWAKIMAKEHTRAVRDLRVGGKRYSIAKEITKRVEIGTRGREDFKALVRDFAFEYANQVDADYGYFMEEMQPDDCDAFI